MVFLLQNVCLQMEKAQETTSTSRGKLTTKSPVRNKRMLKMVEQRFMSFLGVKGTPTKTLNKELKVPEHLLKLYYKWSDDNFKDYDKNNADTARVVYHSIEEDNDERRSSHKRRLHFNISDIQRKEKLHRAELLLFTERHNNKTKNKNHVCIYVNNTNNIIHEHPIVRRKLPDNRLGYASFDVTSTVNTWLNKSIENTVLHVKVDGEDNHQVHLRRRRDVSSYEWHKKRPLLVIYTRSENLHDSKTKKERKRRNAYHIKLKDYKKRNETHQKVRRETCRLRYLRLDFKTLNWNKWIVLPVGYNINYCSGVCPRPLAPHFNTTNHAIIQNSMLSLDPTRASALCCVPTKLKEQAFLYLTSENKLILKNAVQMTAESCGCR